VYTGTGGIDVSPPRPTTLFILDQDALYLPFSFL
jgi:hypothetical protein